MLPCPLSAEIMARQGYDSLVIDMQHGYADFETATNMFRAIGTVVQPSVVTPMARVTWNEPGIIMRALDAGAYGLICPMISNRAEAESFVESCLYPPQGIRSFGPVRSSMMYGLDYQKTANDQVLKFAMIETRESLDKLDEIMSTPGLDGVYIGPADLSLAIGEPPGVDYSKGSATYEAVMRVLEEAKKHEIVAGIHCSDPKYAREMVGLGFQLVTTGMDIELLNAAKNKVSIVKNKVPNI